MIIGHDNGFSVGNDRYGSRQNAVKYMCAGCGREYGPGQGNMGRCPSCGGTLQLMGPDSRDNADPIARRENARAAGQERYGSVGSERYGSRKNANEIYGQKCPVCGILQKYKDVGRHNPGCTYVHKFDDKDPYAED